MSIDQVGAGIVLSILFSVLGFVLLFVGYKIFDVLTPKGLSEIIFHDGNQAAAIMAGAFIIALSIVIAAAIHG